MPRQSWISQRSWPGRDPDRPLHRPIPARKIHEPAFLPLLRIHHGGVRHGADLLEPDRPCQGRAVRPPTDRDRVVRGRRAVFSDFLRLRRHPHRGLWLRPFPTRDLGRLRGPCFRRYHGLDRGRLAPGAFLEEPGGLRNRLRLDLANCSGFPDRVPVRGIRQLVRTGEDENSHAGPVAVDAHHRLAFYGSGLIPDDRLPQIMLVQFVSKVGLEVAFTPLTYTVVGWLKRAEQEDYYDRDTDFNPFTLKT